MKRKKKIIILGTGGTSRDILDIAKDLKFQCVGFLDDDKNKWGKSVNGVKVLGPLKNAVGYDDVFFINGIGSPANFLQKEIIIRNTKIPVKQFTTIIHPSASISKTAFIESGVVIFQNVVISSNAKIGSQVVILPNSVIGHDTSIGDYSCIASGVCISGSVKIGKLCYLGTGSLLKEELSVGDKSLVGMGSVVLNNIDEGSVYAGNPAKLLRSN